MTKFTGSALATALGGNTKLYNTFAPQSATLPYCVFMLVSGTPDWTFSDDMEDCLFQFSLFDSSPSAGTICDNYELLKTLFDDCALTITGWRHLYMQRESQQLVKDPEDPAVWQYIIEYRILTEKTRT